MTKAKKEPRKEFDVVAQTIMIPVALLDENKGQIEGVPKNPRVIKGKRFKQLCESIKEDPELLNLRPLLVYPRGDRYVVIDGNMRVKALRDMAHVMAPCEVLQEGTTPEQMKRYIAKTNSAFGDWDWDALANEWDCDPLDDWGIDLPEDWGKTDEDDKEVVEDEFDEEHDQVETICKKGDIWKLGENRLMCGDSTDAADVTLLMDGAKADISFQSPPYNAGFGKNITKDNGRSKYTNGDNDNHTQSEYHDFLCKVIDNALHFSQYGFVNIQMLANNKQALITTLYDKLDRLGDIMCWDKTRSQPQLAANVLNSEFEFVLVFSEKANRNIGTIPFHGTLKNIVHIAPTRNEYAEEHNAVFPIELPSYFISSFAKSSVLDLFGGSGTTLIAAEQLHRKCYMMELDPHYCDVIIARWEKFTGEKAEKITNINQPK